MFNKLFFTKKYRLTVNFVNKKSYNNIIEYYKRKMDEDVLDYPDFVSYDLRAKYNINVVQEEEFKIAKGFLNYKVSNNGIVKNVRTGKELKKYIVAGEPKVDLYILGKKQSYYVKSLVANNFLDKPENKKNIGFVDGDTLNVNANNLFWY